MAYTYTPSNVADYGPDRMRFELGDTMVEGGVETCALCDEEYSAVLSGLPSSPSARQWKKHKLRCLEAVMRKFALAGKTKVCNCLTLSVLRTFVQRLFQQGLTMPTFSTIYSNVIFTSCLPLRIRHRITWLCL